MRTGAGARSVTADQEAEFGASIANGELDLDAAFSASSRGQTGTAEECAYSAYRQGAGTPERRFRTCSLSTELHRVLLTLPELVGSSLVLVVACVSRRSPAFSGFSWCSCTALFALRALQKAKKVGPDLIGGAESRT